LATIARWGLVNRQSKVKLFSLSYDVTLPHELSSCQGRKSVARVGRAFD